MKLLLDLVKQNTLRVFSEIIKNVINYQELQENDFHVNQTQETDKIKYMKMRFVRKKDNMWTTWTSPILCPCFRNWTVHLCVAGGSTDIGREKHQFTGKSERDRKEKNAVMSSMSLGQTKKLNIFIRTFLLAPLEITSPDEPKNLRRQMRMKLRQWQGNM